MGDPLVVVELFRPSAGLWREASRLRRSLSFEARITEGRHEMHQSGFLSLPSYEMRVRFREQDKSEELALLTWSPYDRHEWTVPSRSFNEQARGFTQSRLFDDHSDEVSASEWLFYNLTLPVDPATFEFADSYYVRQQPLALSVDLLWNYEVAEDQRSEFAQSLEPNTYRYCRFKGLSFVPRPEDQDC
jgi:hypothetical protein